MNVKPLWKPLFVYTGLFGLLTVGTIYFATHSGLYLLISAGIGLLFVVLGGGVAGKTGVTQTEHAGEEGGTELMVDSPGLWSPLDTDTSLRLTLLLYGFGVLLWSLIVLGTLRDTLV